MALKQLSEMTGDLLAANAAVPTQEDRDTVQSMLVRWKNSNSVDPSEEASLETMAAKIYKYLTDNPSVGRYLWHLFKAEQGCDNEFNMQKLDITQIEDIDYDSHPMKSQIPEEILKQILILKKGGNLSQVNEMNKPNNALVKPLNMGKNKK